MLVAAPTGAGKTVVAEHAVSLSLAEGGRVFYTTPIKALSNQKFADLRATHGASRVGLLTGDNAVNPDAPVVVMTTEVLRNMIYAGSPGLDGLRWVILDEVHYLQDTYRGPVWEEVIIQTPSSVRFVCLSATVSNAEELAGWIASARGPTDTVLEHQRPVELINHYLVAERSVDRLIQIPTLVGGRPNLDGDRFDPAPNGGPRHLRYRDRTRNRWVTPRRPEVIRHLHDGALLPTIYFIFSRSACDDAVEAVRGAGFELTDRAEQRRIREIVDRRLAHLDPGDLDALGAGRWRAGLEAGVAAHHAGLVPAFKEAVEECFAAGLVKVVFATETLALGINMPARSVVIEALSKFTGETHEDLTPSQYTQLTGRAGRRGLDPVGHALVLWSPWSNFDRVAALAASREFVLRSAFRPTYNMVVNFIRRHDREHAHRLLGQSFAQFQTDRSVARMNHRRARRMALLAEAETAATCELGDVEEYRSLRRVEREAKRQARRDGRSELTAALVALAPGDVLSLRGHRLGVLSVSQRKAGVRVRVVDVDAHVEVLDEDEFDLAPEVVGELRLPEPFDPQDRKIQHRVAAQLRKVNVSHGNRPDYGPGPVPATITDPSADHPVASCPDLQRHLSAAADRERLASQVAEDDRRLGDRSGNLVRHFERIHGLLERWAVAEGWALTDTGRVLSGVFHEADLLVALALCDGLLDGLEPPEMAGVVSCFTYEHRAKEPPPRPWFPSKVMRDRVVRIEDLARRLNRDEAHAGLPVSRPPDPTLAPLVHAWASGGGLASVLSEELVSGGDFVRNIKNLVDLLHQIEAVAPERRTASVASQAANMLRRGVVASSAEIGQGDIGSGGDQ